MKPISILLMLAIFAITACQTETEKKEEERIDKKVETTVKSDKEKSDSVKKYWEDKMKNIPDTLPK